jgi:hypothetical protein
MLSYDVDILSSGEFIKFIKVRNLETDEEKTINAESTKPELLLLADEGDILTFDKNGCLLRIKPQYETLSTKAKKRLSIERVKIIPHFVEIKDGLLPKYEVGYMHKLILLETGEIAVVDSRKIDVKQWLKIEEEAIVVIDRKYDESCSGHIVKKVK